MHLELFDTFFCQASLVPNVLGVSLCHLADNVMQITPTSFQNVPAPIDSNPSDTINLRQLNLPKGTTDWDVKMYDIISKTKGT